MDAPDPHARWSSAVRFVAALGLVVVSECAPARMDATSPSQTSDQRRDGLVELVASAAGAAGSSAIEEMRSERECLTEVPASEWLLYGSVPIAGEPPEVVVQRLEAAAAFLLSVGFEESQLIPRPSVGKGQLAIGDRVLLKGPAGTVSLMGGDSEILYSASTGCAPTSRP